MDSEINDGGPAFPMNVPDGCEDITEMCSGMSLRDWFAGQALVGLALNQKAYDFSPEGMAQWSYKIADAMLKARK